MTATIESLRDMVNYPRNDSHRWPVYEVNVDVYLSDASDVHTHIARFDGWCAFMAFFRSVPMAADTVVRVDTSLRLVDIPTLQVIVRDAK